MKAAIQAVLVAHQRKDISGCICGWSELGLSHAEHQAEEVLAAIIGYLATEI